MHSPSHSLPEVFHLCITEANKDSPVVMIQVTENQSGLTSTRSMNSTNSSRPSWMLEANTTWAQPTSKRNGLMTISTPILEATLSSHSQTNQTRELTEMCQISASTTVWPCVTYSIQMTAKQSKTTALMFNSTTVRLRFMHPNHHLSRTIVKSYKLSKNEDKIWYYLSLRQYLIKNLVLTQDISIVFELIINF